MSLTKSESHPFIAIRCYADFFIDKDVLDDYSDNCISVPQWMKIFGRVGKIEEFIDKKKDDNIVAGSHVIGYRTAEIITRYIQANIRPYKISIGESEKRNLLFRVEKLIAHFSKERMEKSIIYLDHRPSGEECHAIIEEREAWIDALQSDIRYIDLGPIYQILLVCGSDALLVETIFDFVPEVRSYILQAD